VWVAIWPYVHRSSGRKKVYAVNHLSWRGKIGWCLVKGVAIG